MDSSASGLVDLGVFKNLQDKLEDDQKSREEIRDIVQALEKHEKVVLTALSNAHAAPNGDIMAVAKHVQTTDMQDILAGIAALAQTASKFPYYKYNQMWTRDMQDAVFAIVLCGWLGGFDTGQEGRLLTIEEVGQILHGNDPFVMGAAAAHPNPAQPSLLSLFQSKVPVNLTDRDAFHLTIEEYLHALISLIDELARLARNSVTLGNYQRPMLISRFVKDLHAGFQILNLKNDALRKRNDSIKYKVREIEDVVYDLSLRGLLPAS